MTRMIIRREQQRLEIEKRGPLLRTTAWLQRKKRLLEEGRKDGGSARRERMLLRCPGLEIGYCSLP